MCPACISTAAAIAAGAISSGGLAALAMVTLRRKPSSTDSNIQSQGDDHGTENRNAR